jgi:hypothetical protein
LLAKCSIPAGTLLVVQHAFAFIQSNNENVDRQLINEIEKRLMMAPTVWEFDLIRMMPLIDHWFENETNADEDDYEFVSFFFLFDLFERIYLIVLIQNLYHGVYLLKLNKKIHFDRNQSLGGGLKYPFLKLPMIPNKKQTVFGKIFLLLQ